MGLFGDTLVQKWEYMNGQPPLGGRILGTSLEQICAIRPLMPKEPTFDIGQSKQSGKLWLDYVRFAVRKLTKLHVQGKSAIRHGCREPNASLGCSLPFVAQRTRGNSAQEADMLKTPR